jgi:hypothetical protein
MSAANTTITLQMGVGPHAPTVYAYEHRGPIGTFLFAGTHSAGVALEFSAPPNETADEAETTADTAEQFAQWARKYADLARVHADRLAAAGGVGMTRTIAVEHGGKTYSGQIARIDSTSLGWEDHGILTANLHCTWPGGGISVGGFCLDESTGTPDWARRGTAYGLDHVMRLMETVGVTAWEKLPGEQVIVLFDAEPGRSTLGSRSVGIAGLFNESVLVLQEHADAWDTAVSA